MIRVVRARPGGNKPVFSKSIRSECMLVWPHNLTFEVYFDKNQEHYNLIAFDRNKRFVERFFTTHNRLVESLILVAYGLGNARNEIELDHLIKMAREKWGLESNFVFSVIKRLDNSGIIRHDNERGVVQIPHELIKGLITVSKLNEISHYELSSEPCTLASCSLARHINDIQILFELSPICNLSCTYCVNNAAIDEKHYYSVSDMTMFVDCLRHLHGKPTFHFIFSGGEPFLETNLTKMRCFLRQVLANGDVLSVTIFTNGTVFNEGVRAFITTLKEYLPVLIFISLDMDEEAHVKARGKNFELIVSNAKKMSNLVPVGFKPTITSETDEHRFARSLDRIMFETSSQFLSIGALDKMGRACEMESPSRDKFHAISQSVRQYYLSSIKEAISIAQDDENNDNCPNVGNRRYLTVDSRGYVILPCGDYSFGPQVLTRIKRHHDHRAVFEYMAWTASEGTDNKNCKCCREYNVCRGSCPFSNCDELKGARFEQLETKLNQKFEKATIREMMCRYFPHHFKSIEMSM